MSAKAAVVDAVASPCNSVCTMNPTSGLCEGCLRTIDEIIAWSTLSDDDKRRVWDALALREPSVGPLPSGPSTPAGGGCGTPPPGAS